MEKSTAVALYSSMARIRLVEERIAELYSEQEMRCPVHLCIGQEAIAAGVCNHLGTKDQVISNHRSHGHYLAKNGDLKRMMAEIYGKKTGCAGGKGGSMHLVDHENGFFGATPIVSATIPIAVGVAFNAMLEGKNILSVVFLGDAATEAGVFHESLNFSMTHKLPIVFVCENNLYSVYSPLEVRQPKERTLADLAKGHGVPAWRGDGNNVCDVHEKAEAAISYTRAGKGPTFLEFSTYRWREHCGPNYDNDLGYRTVEEFDEWRKDCPLEFWRQELRHKFHIDTETLAHIEEGISKDIDEAFDFAKTSEFPPLSEMMTNVYAD